MGKRRPVWDHQHYLRYLKEGRGQGSGFNYKPWIYIHDFPSRGISTRIMGRTTGRIHHLLSRNEEYYFYLLDADPTVLDIREQFPLRLTETMDLARQLNIRHPWKGSFPFVMTTDFLITKEDGLHARTIKNSEELNNPRVVDKFAIEHAYWSSKGIDWKIVTENQIDQSLALNMQWLYAGASPEQLLHDPVDLLALRNAVLEMTDENGRLSPDSITTIEEIFSIAPGSAIAMYKSLILAGDISPDLHFQLFF